MKLKKIVALLNEAERDYYKDEALALLLRPMDEIAHMFQTAFLEKDFETSRATDWAKSTIVLEFVRRQPSSDQLRNTIFALYNRKWGRKPDGLDVVYRTGPSRPGAYYAANSPICIYITGSPKALSDLLRQPKHVVLDKIDFQEWQDSAPWEERIRVFNPGDPVPVVKMGLFKV